MDNTKKFTHISLCAGYGGIDMGLKRIIPNLRTVAFSEIEAYAVSNLVAKIEAGYLDAAPIWPNLKTFPYSDFYKKVDIITGGFPCQPFSAAGKRDGDEDPRHLWPYIREGIRLAQPAIVFLENVQGILSSKLRGSNWSDPEGTPVLLHIFRELEKINYTPTAGIFSACEVGAPHQRKRVFILAISNRLTKESKERIFKVIQEYKSVTPYPAFKGSLQYFWEAPRASYKNTKMADPIRKRAQIQVKRKNSSKPVLKCSTQGISKSKMGRTTNGPTCGVDSSNIFTDCENKTDELRLLGNGVVPDTAAKAFYTLWHELAHAQS